MRGHFPDGPVVTAVPSNGVLVLERGKEAHFECSASGNPEPTMFWRKQVRLCGENLSDDSETNRYLHEKRMNLWRSGGLLFLAFYFENIYILIYWHNGSPLGLEIML